ncbi:glycosyltransferase family 1 protein [Leptospira congkakensis]|uniref:Glycosyltransferase family 1 protein n=1 Tax=Leptospira congkakensis TaxID=2484932 RepID=A0A4Z1AC95_9LEPT|nr:glycosyltransferase family 1 protein [Leptospira congkakensis]TGL90246.1 glycosyltransferase family 1 protein [Leptospira congkakensis]TGL91253.1 glycosyltransferase family 1 protein [Leptospira congkakensis]TGL98305.1 glycosyltransferase family 1 protein [Leptospira congkakensis]
MKILFDHQIFFQNKYGGISKIFLEVIRRLKERQIEFDTSVLIEEYSNGILRDTESKERVNLPNNLSLFTLYHLIQMIFRTFRLPLPGFLIKRESGILKRSLRQNIENLNAKVNDALIQNRYSVFHPTYFQNYFLANKQQSKTKSVLTVYDCVHELFPEYYGQSNFILKNRKGLCESADHIICISNTTKKDLLKLYGNISENKISVVHLAGDLSTEPRLKPLFPYPDYILFVGNRSDYKNFKVLLDAFFHLAKTKKFHLVCVGGGEFSSSEKRWIKEYQLEDLVHQVLFSSESVLANYYQNAKVFVYPSLYEGFGIPLLEAMSVGCPVLCSDIEVFHEVANDAAYFFDPKDPFDLQSKLSSLLDSETTRKDLAKKGYTQVNKYSWNQCADEHIRIYQKLSENL